MARGNRLRFKGAIYHAMARGVRKNSIFGSDRDRRKFLNVMATAVTRYGCHCLTYTLMDNHYHVIVRTPRANISRFMQYLNGVYAKYFNWRHGLRGHVFEGRFNAPLIEDTRYLAAAAAYVARNPVSARLVKNAARWKWSSYAATVGACSCPAFLTLDWLERAHGVKDRASARRLFAAAVHNGDDRQAEMNAIARGGKKFRKSVRAVIGATLYATRLPRSYRAMAQPSLKEVFTGIKKSQRRTVIMRAHVVHGYKMSEIARYLDLHPTTISRIVNRSGSYKR